MSDHLNDNPTPPDGKPNSPEIDAANLITDEILNPDENGQPVLEDIKDVNDSGAGKKKDDIVPVTAVAGAVAVGDEDALGAVRPGATSIAGAWLPELDSNESENVGGSGGGRGGTATATAILSFTSGRADTESTGVNGQRQGGDVGASDGDDANNDVDVVLEDAILVDQGEVVDGVAQGLPLKPWYKQKRGWALLGILHIGIAVAVALSVVLEGGSDDEEFGTQALRQTPAPSFIMPMVIPSLAPSFLYPSVMNAPTMRNDTFDGLTSFFEATNSNQTDPNQSCWANSYGWGDPLIPMCEWYGIFCRNDTVVSINMQGNEICGTLPTTLGLIKTLEFLSVADNFMTGTIPEELFDESMPLEFLWLVRNDFNGTFPQNVHALRNTLEQLDVQGNPKLKGTVPTEIGLMTFLDNFQFSYTDMSGTLPSEMGLLSNLVYFYTRGVSNLTGSIPTEFGNLESIRRFDVRQTGVTGTLPTELGLLKNLFLLDLSSIFMTGTIPTEFGNLENLVYMFLSSNDNDSVGLTGTFPSFLHELPVLQEFEIFHNQFTGTLPTEIGLLESITNINVAYNMMTGTIPTEVGVCTNLAQFQIFFNSFTGCLPSEIGLLNSLNTLLSMWTDLSCTVPDEICNMTDDNLVFFGADCDDINCTADCCNFCV